MEGDSFVDEWGVSSRAVQKRLWSLYCSVAFSLDDFSDFLNVCRKHPANPVGSLGGKEQSRCAFLRSTWGTQTVLLMWTVVHCHSQAPGVPDEQASQNLYDLTELPLQWTGRPHPGVEVVQRVFSGFAGRFGRFCFEFSVNSWPPDITQSFIPDISRMLCLQFWQNIWRHD